MTKRLIAFLTIALLLFAAIPLALAEESAPADETAAPVSDTAAAPVGEVEVLPLVRLTVETVSAEADGEATVALRIENGNSVDSLQCNLNYDSSAMKVTKVTPGVTFPAEYCITNTNEAGRVRLAAACALGLNNENGDVILLRCKLNGGAGSSITLTDVIVTTVGAEYVQSKAYIEIVNGGISVGGNALPASAVTPWIPETPIPSAAPTPEPTEAPLPEIVVTPVPTEPPASEPEPAPAKKAMLPYVIAGVMAVLLAAGIVILLVSSSNSKKSRKKKKRKSGNRR